MDYAQILEMRGSAENPMTEVAAMQYGQEYLAQLLVRQAQEEGGGPMNPVEWTQRATNQVLAIFCLGVRSDAVLAFDSYL